MSRAALKPALPVEVWAYTRFSSAKQNDRSSQQQLDEIRSMCRRFGLPAPSAVRVYSDEAKSAKSQQGRESLARMLRDAEAASGRGVCRVLALWNLDRLARNFYDSVLLAEKLNRQLGFRIIDTEGLDSDDEGFRSELASSAEHADRFLRRLSKNTKRGLADAAAIGHYLGKCPTGFVRDLARKTIAIDAESMEDVKFAFEQAHRLRGHIADVARRLRERTGDDWHKRTLTRVLRNRRYVDAGAVSDRLFEDVNAFMAERGKTFNRDKSTGRLRSGKGTGRSALLGIFKCTCGAPVVTVKRDMIDRRLGCRRHNADAACSNGVSVRESVLLSSIVDEISPRLLDFEAIDRLTAAVSAKVQATASRTWDETKRIEREIADRERRVKNLVTQAEEASEAMPELSARVRELREEIVALRTERETVAEPATITVLKPAVEEYLPRVAELLAARGPETSSVLKDIIKNGVMKSEGRGKARFEFDLAPLGAFVSLSASGPRSS
jgi:DNA invertase Pin-like site-specific DNA recombinase